MPLRGRPAWVLSRPALAIPRILTVFTIRLFGPVCRSERCYLAAEAATRTRSVQKTIPQQLAGQSGSDAPCCGPAAARAKERRESARRSPPNATSLKELSTAPPPFNVDSQPHEDVFFTAVHLRRPQLHESAHTLSPPYHVRVLLENDLRIIPGISVLYIVNAPFLLKLYGYIQNEEKILAISRNF